jgi:hypothetical protein
VVALHITFRPTLTESKFIRGSLLDKLVALERVVTGTASHSLCVLHPELFLFRRV